MMNDIKTATPVLGAAFGMALLAGSATTVRAELTGSASLDLNSHFISYGLDIWAAGDDPRWTFNPSVSIDYAINEQWSANAGFWLDVNSNATRRVETVETDIWAGIAYDAGFASFSATFQNWQYGGDSEEILDLGVSVDTLLSPSLTFHKRLDAGASGGMAGWFAVLGLEHTFEVTPEFSVSIPGSLGVALSDFHTTETGYGFASIGLAASYALTEELSANAGVTYWNTDSGVTGNADNDFLSYNIGLSYSF